MSGQTRFSAAKKRCQDKVIDGLRVAVLAFHVFSIPICLSYFLMSCAFPLFWPFLALYTLHIIFDRSHEDGRSLTDNSIAFRHSVYWKLFASYFPITLHKTEDLPPCFVSTGQRTQPLKEPTFLWKLFFWWYYFVVRPYLYKPASSLETKPTGKRYIFGYHPHGIISMGMVGALASEGAGWSKLFPGIPVRGLTLVNQFLVPFYREYLLLLGMASVAKNSCRSLLANNQPISIVIGGARESLLARPGRMDLVLQNRHGFIRLAMEAGNTDVVPVLAFGENDLYDQVRNDESTLLYKIQTMLKNVLGFTLPLMNARGIFNYEVGLLPYRRPVHVVVGRAIGIPHIQNPTDEEIVYYHDLYVKELQRIFEKNKKYYFHDWKGDQTVDNYKMTINV